MEKTVQIISNRHANLDSFPLRYGFSFSEDALLNISFEEHTRKPGKKKGSYSVLAKFINPESKEVEKGIFYLFNMLKEKGVDEVMTVIRDLKNNINDEEQLSSVIRCFRRAKVLTVKDLIQMHPLYINGKINKHVDLYQYLFQKRSSSEGEKIQKIIDELEKDKEKQLDFISELEKDKKKQDDLLEKKDVQIKDMEAQIRAFKDMEAQIRAFNEKAAAQNIKREKQDLSQRTKEYPSVNWKKSTVTSAAFDYWEERGDFLCIYLMGKVEPIRLKNTHVYDYPVALKAVKKLLKGEIFDYLTKGTDSFQTDDWFAKIIRSDGYTTFDYPGHEMTFDDLPSCVIEKENLGSYSKKEVERIVNTHPHPIDSHTAGEANVLESFTELDEQTDTSATTFKIISCERFSGPAFAYAFNHIWRKDMLVLHTDKGWFVDTTIREHGGTEWEEGVTYRNCRVSMTKGKYRPYWLQK